MSEEDLGLPVHDDAFAIAGGQAVLHERGLKIEGSAGSVQVRFGFPMIGKPNIATAAPAVFEHALHFDPGLTNELTTYVQDALRDRFCLVPVGQSNVHLPLVGGQSVRVVDGFSISFTGGELHHRQLYDVAMQTKPDLWEVVAPHAIYGRQSWTDFGIAHITDMHVARRIDEFRETLEAKGRVEAAARMSNWNDRFRGFVRYANYLHAEGLLDVILATGDNYDYQFEKGEAHTSGGNAAFLRDLILGKAPGRHFRDVEELRVPIFMVPGNHDYRIEPYGLVFDLHLDDDMRDKIIAAGAALGGGGAATLHTWLTGKKLARVRNTSSYGLSDDDAAVLAKAVAGTSDIPTAQPDEAAAMVAVDKQNWPYRRYLNELGKYVVELGPHRVVMIDSAHDAGIVTELIAMAKVKAGFGSEDQDAFVGGSPNCSGVPNEAVDDVREALKQPGLVIIGLHAPLFNPVFDGYDFFLRETQRAAQGQQTHGFLAHDTQWPESWDSLAARLESSLPNWFPRPDRPDPTGPNYVKRVNTDAGLRNGVSRGEAEKLIRIIAGLDDASRPADLVLAGHTHFYNEYRLGIDEASRDLAFYMDFYTHNPSDYYPASFMRGWKRADRQDLPVTQYEVDHRATYIEVTPGAERGAPPWEMPFEGLHPYMLQVPPYANPLNNAQNKTEWWNVHRPLVLQTGALGPRKTGGEFFSGFRVITVKNNVIETIHHLSSERLEKHQFRLDWSEAILPERGPRSHHYVERSRAVGAPKGVGVPSGIAALGATNVVYRDRDGQLHEAWRKGADAGTSNLTQLGSNAMTAEGDPTSFVDTFENKQVALYRGTDGHVYSLYWSTGEVGRDALSVAGNASKAKGNPVGYTGKDGYRHVFYRAEDDHVEELSWRGTEAPRPNDISTPYSAPKAAGDPVAYQRPNGENNVFYPGVDKHVHRLVYGDEAVLHEDLSAVAEAADVAGNLSAYYAKQEDSNHIVYRSADGHVHDLSWEGVTKVQRGDLVAVTKDAPLAADGPAGDPVGFYSPADKTHHVVYLGRDGHLYELSWVGSATPTCIDLTAYAVAPVAADRPSGFVDRDGTKHVMYRGKDNQIHEIWWGQPKRVFDVPDGPIIDAQPTELPLEPLDPSVPRPGRGGMTRRPH